MGAVGRTGTRSRVSFMHAVGFQGRSFYERNVLFFPGMITILSIYTYLGWMSRFFSFSFFFPFAKRMKRGGVL